MFSNYKGSNLPVIAIVIVLMTIIFSFNNCGTKFESSGYIELSSHRLPEQPPTNDNNQIPEPIIVDPVVTEETNPIPEVINKVLISSGHGFTEGPAFYYPKQLLYFSDFDFNNPNNDKVFIIDTKTGEKSVWYQNSLGVNGIKFDKENKMFAARGDSKRDIILFDSLEDSQKSLSFTNSINGKTLNAPNDLDIDKSGNIYFTDPTYNRKGEDGEEFLNYQGVYKLTTDGQLINLIDQGFSQPNGIVLSPEQNKLYVSDSELNFINVYDINETGQLVNGQLFYQAPPLEAGVEGKIDGMTVDSLGNIYASGSEKITIISPSGKVFGSIDFNETTTNCTFGGVDKKTLYVTTVKNVFAVNLLLPGILSEAINHQNEVVIDTDPKAPTPPTNLKANIISRTWAEINWQASQSKEGEVVAYNVYRDDKLLEVIQKPKATTSKVNARYFNTTTYIDCNYVESANCGGKQPEPGKTYTYKVTAIDNDGKESKQSEPLKITFHDSVARAVKDNIKNNSDYELVLNEEFTDVSESALSKNWEFRRVWDAQGLYSSIPDIKNLHQQNPRHQQVINGEEGYMVNLSDNEQVQNFNPYQSSQGGQSLKILATKTSNNLQAPAFTQSWGANSTPIITPIPKLPYATGLLRSKQSFSQGYFEGRLKVSGTHGMLSTFYLFHKQFSVDKDKTFGASEIDIMEYLGGSEPLYGKANRGRLIYQTYHYKSSLSPDQPLHRMPSLSFERPDKAHFANDFHTYGVLWEPGLVIWYIDGLEIQRISGEAVTTDPKEIILSLVVGGEWAGSPKENSQASIEVDYVKVYQKKGTTNNTENNNPGSGFNNIKPNIQYNANKDSSVLMKLNNGDVCKVSAPSEVVTDSKIHELLNTKAKAQNSTTPNCP